MEVRLQALGGQLGRRRRPSRQGERRLHRPFKGPPRRASRASTSGSMRFTSPSPRRSARRCSTRPARRSKGRQFAARHAECVFISGPSRQVVGERVRAIRRLTAEAGRDPQAIKIFSLMTVIPGASGAEARARHEEYRSYISPEGVLALVSGWTGLDLSRYRPRRSRALREERFRPLGARGTDDRRSEPAMDHPGGGRHFAGIGGIGPIIVGSATAVADEIQSWVDDTGVDGLNLAYAVTPGELRPFHRARRSRAAEPRRLQDRLSAGHAPREVDGRRPTPRRRIIPAARYRQSGESGRGRSPARRRGKPRVALSSSRFHISAF